MKMQTAKATIRFRRPVLFHAIPASFFDAEVTRAKKPGKAGNDPDEWRHTYRATKDGQLYLTPEMIYSCMTNAAKYTKRGRGSVKTYVQATLQILDDRILLDRWMPDGDPPVNDYEVDVYLDVRAVKNPNSRGTNVRYRIAANHGCETTFNIAYDKSLISFEELNAVLIDAGNLEGLGDGRAIGFGRFDVVNFEKTVGTQT